MSGSKGHGLRGGAFTAAGDYLAYTPVRLRLRGVRFIDDLAVSGRVVWDRRASRVTARLTLAGPVSGRLRLRWPLDEARAVVSIRGTLEGRGVRLHTPAP